MPPIKSKLWLQEEIMLIALRDEEGTTVSGAWYGQAIGGALLSEMLLGGRIVVEETGKHFVNVVSRKSIGNDLIDECLEKIATAKRRASASTWVSRFVNIRQLKHRVAVDLCRKGVLRDDEDRVLWLFRRKIYPEINPQPERQLIERMRKAIFTSTSEVDARTVVLISLANAAELLKIPFDKKK